MKDDLPMNIKSPLLFPDYAQYDQQANDQCEIMDL